MVQLYCKLIISKVKTYEQVPVSLQPQVYVELVKQGYDTSGDKVA